MRRGAAACAGAAVVVTAAAGWYFLAPLASRLSPRRVSTHDRVASAVVGDAVVCIGVRSAIAVLDNDSRSTVVVVERGHAEFDVLPHVRRHPFEARCDDVTVRATDAKFEIVRTGAASMNVRVERGDVRVTALGETFAIGAGHAWER